MTESMVERVARALCTIAGHDPDAIGDLPKPTRSMLRAKHPEGSQTVDRYLDGWEADEVWKAMIDAALSEKATA